MENRNFDKFYADVYGWILYQAQEESREVLNIMLEETPNSSVSEVDGALEFKFNLLTIKGSTVGVETLDEYQDYVLDCIRKNPDWTGSNRDAFYSEMYVQAWISAIKNVLSFFGRDSKRYPILSRFCEVIADSGFTSNLNPHAE